MSPMGSRRVSIHADGGEREDIPQSFLAFRNIIKQAIPYISGHLPWKLSQEYSSPAYLLTIWLRARAVACLRHSPKGNLHCLQPSSASGHGEGAALRLCAS